MKMKYGLTLAENMADAMLRPDVVADCAAIVSGGSWGLTIVVPDGQHYPAAMAIAWQNLSMQVLEADGGAGRNVWKLRLTDSASGEYVSVPYHSLHDAVVDLEELSIQASRKLWDLAHAPS